MALWFWIVGGVLSVLTLLGNGFASCLIITRRRLFTIPNWFVLSLAVADLFFVLCYFPASLICNKLFHCNREHRIMVASIFMYASATNLVALTVDRYIAITFPLRYIVLMTSRRVFAIICSTWIFSAALAASEYFVEHHTVSQTTQRSFEIPRILATEVTPTVLLVVITGRILIIRRKHQRQAAIQVSQLLHNKLKEGTGCHLKLARKEMSSVPMICTVVCVFIVCYAVNISLSICFGLEACSDPPKEVQDILGILLIVNSLINPCAYAFLKSDIKRECKLFLRRKLEE